MDKIGAPCCAYRPVARFVSLNLVESIVENPMTCTNHKALLHRVEHLQPLYYTSHLDKTQTQHDSCTCLEHKQLCPLKGSWPLNKSAPAHHGTQFWAQQAGWWATHSRLRIWMGPFSTKALNAAIFSSSCIRSRCQRIRSSSRHRHPFKMSACLKDVVD